jgi:uncharacterized repeat protein (TIGR01451 family)
VPLQPSTITNTAALLWDGPPLSDSATFDALWTAQPFPVLVKTVSAAEALPGQTNTYTLALTNLGDLALSGAVLSDVLPAGVTYLTSTPPAAFQGGVLTWTVELSPGESATFSVVVQIGPQALPGSTLTNLAVLQWQGEPLSAQAETLVLAPPPVYRTYLPLALRK